MLRPLKVDYTINVIALTPEFKELLSIMKINPAPEGATHIAVSQENGPQYMTDVQIHDGELTPRTLVVPVIYGLDYNVV